MSENNPENGQYPHSIEDEQVLVLGCFGDSYDFLKIIFEGEALEHFYPHAIAFGQPVNNWAQNAQNADESDDSNDEVVRPVHLGVTFDWHIESSSWKDTNSFPSFLLVNIIQIVLQREGKWIVGNLFPAFVGSAQSYVLETDQSVVESHCEVCELIIIVNAVVIISKIIDEFPRIHVHFSW